MSRSRRTASIRIIAILIRSAAVPCNGVFTAVRSGEPALVRVLAVDIRNRPDPPEQCRDFCSRRASSSVLSMNSRDALVLFKICIDELFGFPRLNAESLRQTERREPVNDSES